MFKKIQHQNQQQLTDYYEHLQPTMDERLGVLESKIGRQYLPFQYLYLQKQSLISQGNSLTLLQNGEEKFPHLFSSIKNASRYIHLEYYMITSDDIGNQLTDLLIEKHNEGLEVRIIYDDVGSNKIKKIPKRLKQSGILFTKTLPVVFGSLANSNYRNHRKIAIIDGKRGYIGGINLDDRYINNGKHKLYWRDCSICIEGPAVKLLQSQFFLSWIFSDGQNNFRDRDFYFQPSLKTEGDAIVSIVSSGPNSKAPYIMETMLLAINQAKHKIQICTPYFIPTDQLTSALSIAVSSGVEVELIIPEKSDSFIVQHASFSFIKPLLERGVKIHLYQKGFIHSKTICIDDRLAFVGTVNMDIRSFYLNFEISAIIHEANLCKQLSQSFAQDKKDCSLLTLENWKSRPVLHRAFDSVCRLVAPLL